MQKKEERKIEKCRCVRVFAFVSLLRIIGALEFNFIEINFIFSSWSDVAFGLGQQHFREATSRFASVFGM